MMPVFPDALVADTMHLSAEEFGCYCLILFATWRNNGRAYSDEYDLAHICRIPIRRWRSHMRDRLAPFFTLEHGKWVQQRLTKEWAKAERKAEASRQNVASARDTLRTLRLGDSAGNSEIGQSIKSIQSQSKKKEERSANGHDPFGSLRSPAPLAPLKQHKKEALRQKLMRFAHATLGDGERSAAFLGLMGDDPEHSAQWWLDHLDLAMRAQRWDDAT